MANQLDHILDECLDRILVNGETVEQCLARYPQWSGELEPQLRLSARVSRVHAFTPTAEARARGRQRLRAELQELEQREQSGVALRPFLAWPFTGWALRWAAAAAVLVIAVVLGGGGLVAASGNALPGDALYPVKRATEEVRLAFELAAPDKADLHLVYAERRAGEIRALAEQGRPDNLEAAGLHLRQHVTEAARITGDLQDNSEAARLRERLQESSFRSLTSLQQALQAALEPGQEAASEVFSASSATFGSAIETVAARHPEARASARTGTVQFWASDPPPPEVEQVLVQVVGIEAYLAAGDDSRWETITHEPQTFDLLRATEVQKFLGERQVPQGTYSRVRFRITGATAVVAGEERPVQVPGDAITLVRPFRVAEGQTTVVVLDFDGRRSFQATGQGQLIITPVVRVLTQEPGVPQGRIGRRDAPGQPETQPDLSRGLLSRAEITGAVEAVSDGHITVAGQRIRTDSSTRVEDTPQEGRRVQVEVALQPDGTFLATRVRLEGAARIGTPTPPRPDDEEPEEEPGPTPGPARVEIRGVIESMQSEEWLVSGQRVRLGPATSVNGPASAGATVRVEGIRQADGAVAALRITVTATRETPARATPTPTSAPPELPTSAPTPLPTEEAPLRIAGTLRERQGNRWWLEGAVEGNVVVQGPDTVVQGTLEPGATVEVEGLPQPGGAILALWIKVTGRDSSTPTPEPTPRLTPTPFIPTVTPPVPTAEAQRTPEPGPEQQPVQFQGVIESLQGGLWQVSGRTVMLDIDTRIEGLPIVGATVQVTGNQRPDGTVLATSIAVVPAPDPAPTSDLLPGP